MLIGSPGSYLIPATPDSGITLSICCISPFIDVKGIRLMNLMKFPQR